MSSSEINFDGYLFFNAHKKYVLHEIIQFYRTTYIGMLRFIIKFQICCYNKYYGNELEILNLD